jgi:hypothetical protein
MANDSRCLWPLDWRKSLQDVTESFLRDRFGRFDNDAIYDIGFRTIDDYDELDLFISDDIEYVRDFAPAEMQEILCNALLTRRWIMRLLLSRFRFTLLYFTLFLDPRKTTRLGLANPLLWEHRNAD